MNTIIKFVTPALAILALSACQKPLSADFGNATNHNFSLQIVDPQPTYLAPETPDFDGERNELAIERYKTGTVIEPEEIDSQEGGD